MSTMTPELALVDPELRADAIARLPPIYVNSFLEFPELPPPVLAERHGTTPRASAVLAYLLLTVARTVVFEAAVFAAVAVLVLLASLLA